MAGEGARIIDLVDNVPDIVSDAPDLITVLIGSNDACAPAIDEMTSVDDFAASAEQLLVPLSEQLPDSVDPRDVDPRSRAALEDRPRRRGRRARMGLEPGVPVAAGRAAVDGRGR